MDPLYDEDRPDPADLAVMGITEEAFMRELAEADERARLRREREPYAVSARYDAPSGQFVIGLSTGATFLFPARLAQGLAGGDPEALADVEISPMGDCLHWARLDADFSLLGLMMGSFGGQAWMSRLRQEVGRLNGAVTSEAKAKAARENGKKGGRPRKRKPA